MPVSEHEVRACTASIVREKKDARQVLAPAEHLSEESIGRKPVSEHGVRACTAKKCANGRKMHGRCSHMQSMAIT